MKKYKIWLWWLVGILLFLVIVQILFSIPAPVKWLEAVWSAGDLITFIGTVFLGCVAIAQTQEANRMSEKLMEMEENRYKLDIRPFFMVTDYKVYELSSYDIINSPDKLYIEIDSTCDSDKILGIDLYLLNTTNSFITVEYATGSSEKIRWTNSTVNQPNRKLRLLPNESSEIVFYGGENFVKELRGQKITVKFILENRIAERYEETFDFIITAISQHCSNKWYCDCIIQNFKIGKFVKDSSGKIELKIEEELDDTLN